MTKEALEALFERVRSWPAEKQAEAVDMLETLDQKQGIYRLSDEERAAVMRGLDDSANRRFASPERLAKIFGRPV
jgi:hypothetical protein